MMSDEEYGAVVLRPLAGEPRAPSMVDIARALADGRRRRRVRKIKVYCASTAAAVLVLAGGAALVAPRPDARPPLVAESSPAVPQPSPPTQPSAPAPTAQPSASHPASANTPSAPVSCKVERLPIP